MYADAGDVSRPMCDVRQFCNSLILFILGLLCFNFSNIIEDECDVSRSICDIFSSFVFVTSSYFYCRLTVV